MYNLSLNVPIDKYQVLNCSVLKYLAFLASNV